MTTISSLALLSRRHMLLGGLSVAATGGAVSIAAAEAVSEHRHSNPHTIKGSTP
jgi:hypothetical protein